MKIGPIALAMILALSLISGCTGNNDEIDEKNATITDLENQITNLNTENEELISQLESADENINLMSNITSELQDSLSNANASIDELILQLSQNQATITVLTGERDALQEELDEAIASNSSTISTLESQVELLNQQITQLISNSADLQEQLEDVQNEVSALTNSLNALSDSVSKLTYQLFDDVQGCPLDYPTTKLKIGFDDGAGSGTPDDRLLQGAEVVMSFGECSGYTGMVADISSSNPGISQLVEMNGVLYFTADDGVHGNELWRSDGTVGGTWMVIDLSPPMCPTCTNMDSDIRELVAGDRHLFFASIEMNEGAPDLIRELFVSDGTEEGTEIVVDLFDCPTVSGDVVITYDGVNSLVAIPGSSFGTPGLDRVVFSGFSCSTQNWVCYGEEPWISDGTAVGTIQLADIRAGDDWLQTPNGQGVMVDAEGSSPRHFFMGLNEIYFTADDNESGRELWSVDLTQITSGANVVKDINPGHDSSVGLYHNLHFALLGNNIFFSANDGSTGYELWKTDGSESGTMQVNNIAVNETSSYPSFLTVVGNTLYFAAWDGDDDTHKLWKSDGTFAGTSIVKDSIFPVFAVVGNALYFSHGTELWKSDGTVSGTVMVKDIYSGGGGSTPSWLTAVGNTLYFRADDGTNGDELWKSDGTSAGTVMVKDIRSGSSSSSPSYLTAVGNTLYFIANDGSRGYELWSHIDTLGPVIS